MTTPSKPAHRSNRLLPHVKSLAAATTLFALAITVPLRGQTPSKVQEPAYVNSFFLVDPDANLKPLEREPVGVGGRVKALGFGGAEVTYQIQNEHSPVRVAAGSPVEIIVRLERQDVDPATVVLLYPLKLAKGQRQVLINSAHPFSGRTKSDLQTSQVQLTFTKYGESSLKVVPQAALAPGEYAITVQTQGNNQPPAYCFGVDPAR